MKSYPNTDFYLINYAPGASGTFLQSFMALVYYNSDYNSFTGMGNAADSVNPRYFNERCEEGTDNIPIYQNVLNVRPIRNLRPVFSRSHNVPDLTLLYKKFPKTRHIIIKLDDNGKMIACLQNFQKNFIDQYRLGPFSNTFDKWPTCSQQYFNNISDPRTATKSQLISYTHAMSKSESPYPYDHKHTIDNSLTINLIDIYFKKNKIMDLISELLEKPICKSAMDYYNLYLEKQHHVLELLNLGYPDVGIDGHIHN